MEIIWWHNDQPWSLYILGSLAWPLSTFLVNLLSLVCMTDILFSPSISSISLLFQVCWLIRSCMIRSRSNTWLDSLTLISFLLDSGYSLYSRSQALPVSHTSIWGTTGDWWEPVSPGEGNRMLLNSLLSSAKLIMTSRRICGTSSYLLILVTWKRLNTETTQHGNDSTQKRIKNTRKPLKNRFFLRRFHDFFKFFGNPSKFKFWGVSSFFWSIS